MFIYFNKIGFYLVYLYSNNKLIYCDKVCSNKIFLDINYGVYSLVCICGNYYYSTSFIYSELFNKLYINYNKMIKINVIDKYYHNRIDKGVIHIV